MCLACGVGDPVNLCTLVVAGMFDDVQPEGLRVLPPEVKLRSSQTNPQRVLPADRSATTCTTPGTGASAPAWNR
jgi:hypothetical protein